MPPIPFAETESHPVASSKGLFQQPAKAGPPIRNSSRATTDYRGAPTLRDLGISRDQSSKWQKLAAVPQGDFDAALAGPDKPSTSGIIAKATPTETEPETQKEPEQQEELDAALAGPDKPATSGITATAAAPMSEATAEAEVPVFQEPRAKALNKPEQPRWLIRQYKNGKVKIRGERYAIAIDPDSLFRSLNEFEQVLTIDPNDLLAFCKRPTETACRLAPDIAAWLGRIRP